MIRAKSAECDEWLKRNPDSIISDKFADCANVREQKTLPNMIRFINGLIYFAGGPSEMQSNALDKNVLAAELGSSGKDMCDVMNCFLYSQY